MLSDAPELLVEEAPLPDAYWPLSWIIHTAILKSGVVYLVHIRYRHSVSKSYRNYFTLSERELDSAVKAALLRTCPRLWGPGGEEAS